MTQALSLGWDDALTVAALLAVDPSGLGGVRLNGPAGAERKLWLETLERLLPPGTPFIPVPASIDHVRLAGGLDLAETLAAGRPVMRRGALSQAEGGFAVIQMADTWDEDRLGLLGLALDGEHEAVREASPFALILLDEAEPDAAPTAPALAQRLAFHVELPPLRYGEAPSIGLSAEDIAKARTRFFTMTLSDEAQQELSALALALDVGSLRADLLARRAAMAHAALADREEPIALDIALAARLVLGPRARALPAPPDQENEEESEPPPPPPQEDMEDPPEPPDDQSEPSDLTPNLDQLIDAIAANLPPDMLAKLEAARGGAAAARSRGRTKAKVKAKQRGRPAGVRRMRPGDATRLDVVETLRAAVPFQKIRRRQAHQPVAVRADDFRTRRLKQRQSQTVIFMVDASGSSALNRLAEAKGAIELILAECYVRRDEVALIAFRGERAEILLAPTRSLARAKRALTALPGGGGTPLAMGLEAGLRLALHVEREGQGALLVMMSDGGANIALDGTPGRAQAGDDARDMARAFRANGLAWLAIDTSPRGNAQMRALSEDGGATYVRLPAADARGVSSAVQSYSDAMQGAE
ncbi:MAG: magnesium chelatase subunit D [Pseudomonadota bacterium]